MVKLNIVYRIGVIAMLVAFNIVVAQAIPTATPDFSDAELLTAKRQFIAFTLGSFTQFFASIFLNKTTPWRRWFAQTVLAGIVAAAFIGSARDWLHWNLQLGGETALASLIGWLGAEAGFTWLGQIFKRLIEFATPAAVKTAKGDDDA